MRQQVAALESAYRIGRLLVLREVLGQAPRGFSAATKTYCTEYEQRVAAFCAAVLGVAAQAWTGADADSDVAADLAERVARGVVLRARLHLDGRHDAGAAQHHRRTASWPATRALIGCAVRRVPATCVRGSTPCRTTTSW